MHRCSNHDGMTIDHMSLEDFGAAHLRGWLWLGTQSINKPSNFHTEGCPDEHWPLGNGNLVELNQL